MSLETEPQMKRTELVSSQAQSLTKKYQETKELLQLQELKKRNMQAQLGLSLSHWSTKEPYLSDTQNTCTSEICPSNSIKKTVSFTLFDSQGKIRELENLIDVSKPLTLRELINLVHLHSECPWLQCTQGQERKEHSRSGEMTQCQKLLENIKSQEEIENETLRKSLENARVCIRDYEASLVTMEDTLGQVQRQKLEGLMNPYTSACSREEHPEILTRDLLQQVELLRNENIALNQRYQEIVNQLREADREIDRLKAELDRLRCTQGNVIQDTTEQDDKETDKHVYEQALCEKSQQLQEALNKLEVLGNNLKETDKRLQLKEATLRGLGFQVAENDDGDKSPPETKELERQIDVIHSKLSVKEQMLHNVEQICRELQTLNTELITKNEESTRMFSQMLEDAQIEIRTLKEQANAEVTFGSKTETKRDCQELIRREVQKHDDRIEEVVEEFKRKSESLNHVLDMLVKGSEVKKCNSSNFDMEAILGENQVGLKEMFEKKILHTVLGGLEESQKGSGGEQPLGPIRNVVEHMLMDMKLLLFMNTISYPKDIQSIGMPTTCTEESTGCIWRDETTTISKNCNYLFGDDAYSCILKSIVGVIGKKVVSLNQIASGIRDPTNEQLQSLALTLSSYGSRCWSEYIREAVLDVTCTYLVIQLNMLEKKYSEKEKHLEVGACVNCFDLRAQNLKLKCELKKVAMSNFQSPITGDSMAVTHIHIEPIDSLDKAIQLQDMVARQKKELRELKGAYEREADKLREEVAKAGETLRLRSEENVKDIDSLTMSMENLQKKHEMESCNLIAQFNQVMEELTDAVGPNDAKPGEDGKPDLAFLALRIKKLVSQLRELSDETSQRDREGDPTLQRLKYEKNLENIKVKKFLVLAVLCS